MNTKYSNPKNQAVVSDLAIFLLRIVFGATQFQTSDTDMDFSITKIIKSLSSDD